MSQERESLLTPKEFQIIDDIFREIREELRIELEKASLAETRRSTFSEKIKELFLKKIRIKIEQREISREKGELIILTYNYLPKTLEVLNTLREHRDIKLNSVPIGETDMLNMMISAPEEDTLIKRQEEPDWSNLETNPPTVINPREPVEYSDINPPKNRLDVQLDLPIDKE